MLSKQSILESIPSCLIILRVTSKAGLLVWPISTYRITFRKRVGPGKVLDVSFVSGIILECLGQRQKSRVAGVRNLGGTNRIPGGQLAVMTR